MFKKKNNMISPFKLCLHQVGYQLQPDPGGQGLLQQQRLPGRPRPDDCSRQHGRVRIYNFIGNESMSL